MRAHGVEGSRSSERESESESESARESERERETERERDPRDEVLLPGREITGGGP
jgi:hypothetical protein